MVDVVQVEGITLQSTQELRSRVREYYDHTRWDYKYIWSAGSYRALHFGLYDEQARTHGAALENTNRTLAERAGIESGWRVLDAGCGIGGSSLWLALNVGAVAVGITPVVSQVKSARRIARRLGMERHATFLVADYTGTPFPDASFDVVWALESICHAPDKAAFYAEASRLLKPNGRLVAAEYMRSGKPLDARGRRLMMELCEGWAMPGLETPEQHAAYAEAAGLTNVELEDATSRARPSLRRLYRIARFCQPLAFAARWMNWRSATQHANVTAAIRQYQALEQALWRYHLITAVKPDATG